MKLMIKSLTRLSLLLLLFAVLLPAARAYTATGNLPIQSEPTGATWATVVSDASAESTSPSPPGSKNPTNGGTPIYHSTQLEETTLSGDFTADADTAYLAIFSDDGCDVTIDGNKVWSGRDKGQALPDLPNSLHLLPITLTPGQTYHIQIDYSNIVYLGDGDIDGCTLFAYGTAPVVSVQATHWQPDPATVNQDITSSVTASVVNSYESATGDSISENWDWATDSVYESDSGVSGSFTPYQGSCGISWPSGNPTTTFTGNFSSAGYYIVKVRASVTYYDNTTKTNVLTCSGYGYVGGSATDIAPPPSSPSAYGMSAHQMMRPRDVGTPAGTGMPVTPTISLVGPILDANNNPNILVGQGCTASLTGLVIPKGATVTYNWTVSGTFQDWVVEETADNTGNPTGSTGTRTLGLGPASNSTAHWYWSDTAGDKTVTCQVTLTPPAGQGPASQMTATKTVTLWVPQDTIKPLVGRVQINANQPGAPPGEMRLYAGAGGTPFSSKGFDVSGTVTLPASPAPFSGTGAWNVVQIVRPGRWRTYDGSPERPWPFDGRVGADSSYPYEPAPYTGTTPSQLSPGHTPTGTLFETSDSPYIPLDDHYSNYRVSEKFSTYIMFLPPGNDARWVPLRRIDWGWNAAVSRPGDHWAGWKDTPANNTKAGTMTPPSMVQETTHPEWKSMIIAPSDW